MSYSVNIKKLLQITVKLERFFIEIGLQMSESVDQISDNRNPLPHLYFTIDLA